MLIQEIVVLGRAAASGMTRCGHVCAVSHHLTNPSTPPSPAALSSWDPPPVPVHVQTMDLSHGEHMQHQPRNHLDADKRPCFQMSE